MFFGVCVDLDPHSAALFGRLPWSVSLAGHRCLHPPAEFTTKEEATLTPALSLRRGAD